MSREIDATAINVMTPDITVDLNGFTITYNNRSGVTDPNSAENTFGYLGCRVLMVYEARLAHEESICTTVWSDNKGQEKAALASAARWLF